MEHRIGNIYYIEDSLSKYYILALVDTNKITFIGLITGNRLNHPIEAKKFPYISDEEITELLKTKRECSYIGTIKDFTNFKNSKNFIHSDRFNLRSPIRKNYDT